jgi:hypothetical protein
MSRELTMDKRKALARIAKNEALHFFHGFVMKTEPNFFPIIRLFPKWPIEKWDGRWCAAFVYYCCVKAGFSIPVLGPDEINGDNFASCRTWDIWAQLKENSFYYLPEIGDFIPSRGDIVLYDNVFDDAPLDHMGIILENKRDSIIAAEGNINNISGIIERKKDSHVRAYIRIPNDF